MPERPKRRKNNKNKRKNKQQSRSEANRGQNSIDTKKSDESKPVENDDEPSVSNYVSAKNVTNEQEEIDDSKTESHMNVSQYEINKETDIINTSKQLQVTEIEDAGISSAISDTAELQDYLVESPDQSLKHKVKEKLGNTIKSKSLDNDDEPKIVEIGEYSVPKSNEMSLEILNSSNVTVSDTESDVDWEVVNNLDDAPLPKNNDMAVGTLSIQTIPLTVAKCENNQVLTTEEELSLRKYLQTLDLATHPATLEVQTEIERTVEVKHRLRKKSSPNDFVFTHGPRHLDVIDEEGSGESSLASRRHSALNVTKNDCCSLEDEVFLTKEENEDHQSKINNRKNIKHLTREIPQQCVLVDAKMIAPAISEARGDWSVKTMEKLSGAEVVYLTDSSSSASDIYDLEEEDEIDDGIETDTSVRIITPTIEVTDTDNLLKNQFLAPKENKSDCILIEEETDNTSNKNPHEIIVLSTENINPSLYVINATDEKQESVKMTSTDLKESLNNNISVNNKEISTKDTDENVIGVKSDFGLGDLRIELNDAFNNLVKEVSNSESGNDAKESVSRQDSSSSVCSSQCTAKYNPNYSSLNDITNITHDETPDSNIHTEDTKTMNTSLSSHVKEVFECVTGSTKTNTKYESHHEPAVLKDLCVRRIAQFPYGEKILEELAHVSERLQNISIVRTNAPCININNVKMPYYPLPDVSSIDKVALPIKDYNGKSNDKIAPPPLLPRNSSLKKTLDEPHWTGIPTHKDPVYVCLSPSQKMLMEKTNTIITKEDASQLVDMHKKYVDRRGYDENKNDNYESPIAIPFKSQTGSRLLALIRDPAVTNNIYSNNTRRHKSVELLHSNTTSHWDKKSFNHNYNNSVKDVNNGGIFRPIPPPRLKKYSSTMYESDESSDFTDNSLRSVKSERKFFHYSTGNLNKQIENDVSSIQSMHRHYVNTRETLDNETKPRRPSLPKDLCEQQMEYIRQKEKEIEAEINRLESKKLNVEKKPRAPLLTDKEIIDEKYFDVNNYHISRKRDIALELPKLNDSKKSLFSSSQEELLRDKMYTEYVTKMAERQERKEKKVIKITNGNKISKSLSSLEVVDPKMNNRIEEEFISKARERWNKLGIRDPETEDEREDCKNMYKEPVVIKHKIKVIEDNEEKEVQQLPNHLQEFVKFTAKKEQSASSPAVWRPGAPTPPPAPASPAPSAHSPATSGPPPPPLPVWTPNSAGPSPVTSRKSFRPVHFEETPPARRKQTTSTVRQENGCTSGSESESRLRTSQSAPVTGLNTLSGPSPPNRYPKAQNPTVTLLQKAREGQLPRGSNYLQDRDTARLPRDRITPPRSDPVHALRREYASEGEAERSDYERGATQKMADAHRKVEGIGPTTKDGMPVALRSEVKDPSRWYKKMYDTIHKNKYDDDYVTVRYKNHRGQPGSPRPPSNKSQYAYFDPRSGYLSEPEGGISRISNWSDAYDSDAMSGPRRRTASVQEGRQDEELLSPYLPSNKYSTLASARASQEVYKNQPGRIEDYVPGKSSVVDKEAKQWWDEVMDIFDGWLDENSPLPPYGTLLARAIQKNQLSSTTSLPQASPKEKKDLTSNILSKSNMARALKESGYESDSTLVFRRREDTDGPLSPAERRAAYRDLQAGGEPPLRGFRSPAPPRQDDSDIEYIPLSPTLTKIRVHKKQPQEVICYPLQYRQENTKEKAKKYDANNGKHLIENPPAPPRRISSKNSRTLKLVTYTKPATSRISPARALEVKEQSNVDFIKDKLRHKLVRQNTHTIIRNKKITTDSKMIYNPANKQKRLASTSAPPAIDRKSTPLYSTPCKTIKRSAIVPKISKCTSSFSSPRRTLLPTEYTNPIYSKFGDSSNSRVVVEGGVGRKTPISNILDRVSPLDKLWNSEKRSGPCSASQKSRNLPSLLPITKSSTTNNLANRGRDMVRTSEKLKKAKSLNSKSISCQSLQTKSESKVTGSQSTSLKKSTSNLNLISKKPQVKTATITNLKSKKTPDSLIYRPRSVPCHASCSKKNISPSKVTKNTKDNIQSKFDKRCDSQSYTNLNMNSDYNKSALKMRHLNEIKVQRDNIISDQFFQHLFLKNKNLSSLPMSNLFEQDTSVLQKARMFQSYPQDFNISRSLNTYLINRKPVSESRFKLWDRYPSPEKYSSPRSISWPGRMYRDVRKFDSLIGEREDFGSTASLASVRSRSEPPTNTMFFSQTTRPKSPTVIFYKKQKPRSPSREPSPSKIIFTETSRPISPKIIQKVVVLPREKSKSPTKIIFTETSRPISPTKMYPTRIIKKEERSPSRIVLSETSRPVSPIITRKSTSESKSRSHSVSPVSIRSPSYRRIHSARVLSSKTDPIKTKKIIRTRSAGDADKSNYKPIERNFLNETDPDYDEYLRDIENNRMRSERFRELNRYYSYLERVGELERATSNCDLRHRKKDEEIIDFDRWKKIRSIERAEEELNNLYDKLRSAQNEKDVLFYPRDVTDFRWNHNRERGLKIKEKSVEDLKEHFQQISDSDADISLSRDTYKPLWRGTSVAETAYNINRKNETFEDNKILPKRSKSPCQQDSFFEVRKKLGIGSRLWSSLSMDQVNALKNQLNSIYSKDNKITTTSPPEKPCDNYTVNVTETTSIKPNLQVRSNSLISNDKHKFKENEICKSDSIAAINCADSTAKDSKSNGDQMALSESEKKRISQTLSNEVLNRIKKMNGTSETGLKTETSFPIEQFENNNKATFPIQETIKNLERIIKTPKIENEKSTDFRSEKSETSLPSSASETETASSDLSNKTVIYKGPAKEVQKKINYFESVKTVSEQSKTIYHAREDSDENPHNQSDVTTKIDIKTENQNIKQSQSCTNFKELFGESEKNKFLSLPPKAGRYSRSPSPHSDVYVVDRRTPDTLRYSSSETLCRSRSASPVSDSNLCAYLKLARAGEVRRLARRFDSPQPILRRYRSDPELTRSGFRNNWQSMDKRTKRTISPVARVPLRPNNRFMPHIDIISKLAALRRRTTPRSRSADEVPECRPGEVDRMRRRFETMSILGQIYTSAPDVSELRDIAPYLAGPWIAHKYPKQNDNNKSAKDGTLIQGRRSPIRRDMKKKIAPKETVKLSSILKTDAFGSQVFDAAAHRPASRYEPPRAPPRPPPAAWPYRLAPYVTPHRHTVTFQETPEPLLRAPGSSISDTESPRRYLESDVNIHYRCPVRRDPLPLVPERELAKQQAEHMRKLYREQRRAKYLQDINPAHIDAFDESIKELQDMQNRRHQDNFTPSQKNILPLNRYDEAEKSIARALYTFNGQTGRELSFRKGDIINVRRQVDANWYEGELQGRVGLFPYNYVEILKGDVVAQKKPAVVEGRARAKFDFTAQTNLELPLKKGEIVTLTRRIDHNWWEGKRGNHTGIFPDSYITVLQEPSLHKSDIISSSEKPVGSPASHGLVNGSARRSMGSHVYTPQINSQSLSNAPPATQPLPGYTAKPAQATLTPSERGYGPPTGTGTDLNNSEPLYVDTNAEAVPYRAMYKYRPQNPDELELKEGDTVYVLEKCDDGWYVGSSQRTGRFGTFPGNYVERI